MTIKDDPTLKMLREAAEHKNIDIGLLFEDAVKAFAQHNIKPGDHVLDIGANKGDHTKHMAASVGLFGKVHAFEPIPKLAKKLRKKLTFTERLSTKIYPLAVSRQAGTASFEYFHKFPAYSGLMRRQTPFDDSEGERETITVDLVTLDSLFADKKPISFIKLDIEGGEYHALCGARQILKKHRPLIVFENGRQAAANIYGYKAAEFFKFFTDIQYKIYTIGGIEFTLEDWHTPHNCWEFFAYPVERASESRILPKLALKNL